MKKTFQTLIFFLLIYAASAQSLMDLAKSAGDENTKDNYFNSQ